MLKKLFDRDQIWFAVLWIVVYVFGFGNADMLSETIGVPKLLTVLLGLVLSAVLYSFVRRHGLSGYYGLCRGRGGRRFLYFIPLAVISSVNFWNGVTVNAPALESLLYIASMCFVGFLEELIFRGMLFKGMCQSNVKAAIIVSSLTFGAGHIVNLLMGAPLLDTLLQLVYAAAVGFCYTAVFYVGGSILPCILSHIVVNATSIFAATPDSGMNILIAMAQTGMSIAYGLWLLHAAKKMQA